MLLARGGLAPTLCGSCMADDFTIPEHRELTTNERNLLEWLLENGSPKASSFTAQLTEVKVVGHCTCGCPSIDLAIGGKDSRTVGPSTILCDAEGHSPEGVPIMVTLHAREGELSELEVITDYEVDVCTIPAPSMLEPICWNAT
jgi:hypothetical protein